MIKFFVAGLPRAMSVSKTIVAGNRRFQKRANNEWALQVGYAGRAVAPAAPMKGALSFAAHFLVPKPKSARKVDTQPVKRPDLDNLIHKLTDQWNGVFYEDDSQIVRIVATKNYATLAVPGVTIIVEEIGAEIVPLPVGESASAEGARCGGWRGRGSDPCPES